jgi:hypothetical protein
MDIRNFIDLVGAGQNAEAKDALDEILSGKAFEALEGRKQEIAGSLYSTEQPEVSEEDEEVAYAEGVDQDGEQLDEVSLELARKVYKQRAGGVVGTVDTKNRTTAQDKAQQERSKKIIDSRFGKKGKAMTHKVDVEHDYYD